MSTLAVLGIREYKSPTKGKDFSQARLSRLVAFLGSVPEKAAIPLAALSVVILLSGIALEGRLQLQTDPISWVNPQSQAIQNLETLKDKTGSDNEIAMRISTDHPWSNQTVDYVVKFSRQLQAKYPSYLYPGAGLINTVDEFMTEPGMIDIPPTGAEMSQLYDMAPAGIRKTTVADGGGALNVIFLGKVDTLNALDPVVKDLQGGINPPGGITVAPGGIATVGVGLIENLEKSRVQLTYLALLFVGAFLALRLRSLIRALLSLVPVLVAVGAVSLIAVGFNLKLSPVTAVAGPLVVAVCTEFTSLILLRFVEERQRGLSPRASMDATARRTGRAFMVSGMTAVAGVATLGLSSMPLLSDFGVIVAINVSVALFSALVVLPPMLVWAEGHNWVTQGLLRPIPQPYLTREEEVAEIRQAMHLEPAMAAAGPVAHTRGTAASPPPPPPPTAAVPVTPAVPSTLPAPAGPAPNGAAAPPVPVPAAAPATPVAPATPAAPATPVAPAAVVAPAPAVEGSRRFTPLPADWRRTMSPGTAPSPEPNAHPVLDTHDGNGALPIDSRPPEPAGKAHELWVVPPSDNGA